MRNRRGWSNEEQELSRFCRLLGNGAAAVVVRGDVDIMQGTVRITKGDDVVKWYLVTVRIDGTITNKLIRAASPDEAEKEALECASQETTGSPAQG